MGRKEAGREEGMGDKTPDLTERPVQNEVSCVWHWRSKDRGSLAQRMQYFADKLISVPYLTQLKASKTQLVKEFGRQKSLKT